MALSKKTRRIFLIIVAAGMITGAWAVWYVFYKPHRNVGAEKAAYTLTAKGLSEAFKTDTTAQHKYIDKAILIEGNITAIEGNHISFDNVICNLTGSDTAKISSLKIGAPVKIQGRLTTYNDLMEEIMMDQCVLK
jgi:tRNA_anti-like